MDAACESARRRVGWRAVLLGLVGLVVADRPAVAELGDLRADGAFGQGDADHAQAQPLGPASFAKPRGVAVDLSATPNRVFVSDSEYSRVLGWSDADALVNGAPADLVIGQPDFTSFGCNGHTADSGSTPPATLSSLCEPEGLAVDATGNLYVADTRNCRVLVFFDPFATDAVADLVLGTSGWCGLSAEHLFEPRGVMVDGSGNVYVADPPNFRVLEYDGPLGSTDVLPDRVYGQVDFDSRDYGFGRMFLPQSMAKHPDGALFIGTGGDVFEFDDPFNETLTASRRLGTLLCNACSGGACPKEETASTTCSAIAVAVDAGGRLYVGDAGNSRVLEFDDPRTSWSADRVFGQPGFGGSTDFSSEDCNRGGVGAASLCLRRYKINPGNITHEEGAALALDGAGRLYVADTLNHRVLRYDDPRVDSAADVVLGQPQADDVRKPVLPVLGPHVAVDGPGPGIVIAGAYTLIAIDSELSRILLDHPIHPVNVPGLPVGVIGQPDFATTGCNSGGLNAASLCNPTAAAVDAGGNLWVADTGNNRVLRFDFPWMEWDRDALEWVIKSAADAVLGQPDFSSNGCAGGPGGLCAPAGVATAADGSLFVSDSGNNRVVRHLDPSTDSAADEVFGQMDFSGSACNATGVDAGSLCDPRGIDIAPTGDLYVADRANHRVLAYAIGDSSPAVADRVFGQNGSFTSAVCATGPGGLCGPSDVGFDGAGNLLIADTDNNRVLQYVSPAADTSADLVLGQPDLTSTACNNGGLSDASLCGPVGVAVTSNPGLWGGGDLLLVGDAGNRRVLSFRAPYCLRDFRLDATTARLKGISRPLKTKVIAKRSEAVGEHTLKLKDRLYLLASDGSVGVGFSGAPLVTLSTANDVVFRGRVPYLQNLRFRDTVSVWSTGLKNERYDAGIDAFKVVDSFKTSPSRQEIKYRGRALELDLSSFTEPGAALRLQFGSTCFTTELTCKQRPSSVRCKPSE